jgi:hypothetical protein
VLRVQLLQTHCPLVGPGLVLELGLGLRAVLLAALRQNP